MALPKTRGHCTKCDKDFALAGMGKHLGACLGPGPALHVAIDSGPGTWWIQLALAPSVTLDQLDDMLRGLWLECCGHLSAFEVGGARYESSSEDWDDFGFGRKPRSMKVKAAEALPVGATFRHEYDFGTTTVLRGKVIGSIAAGTEKISFLAQNLPVEWTCGSCGAAAERVCQFCWAMVCESCEAPCSCLDSFKEESLPVVDSPRMGMCGYTG